MSTCAGCGKSVGDAHMFCRRCGKRVGVACVCGAVGTSDDAFCWQCGRAMGDRAAASCRNNGNRDTSPETESGGAREDMLAEAERDGRQFRLNRMNLDQRDIDEIFDEKGED